MAEVRCDQTLRPLSSRGIPRCNHPIALLIVCQVLCFSVYHARLLVESLRTLRFTVLSTDQDSYGGLVSPLTGPGSVRSAEDAA